MTEWAKRMALLWAGLVLGGSLIAAPAKFQVEALSLPVALQVGRAQFLWVSIAEVCLLIAIGLLLVVQWRANARFDASTWFLLLAAALFAVQHLLLMPLLQTRSERIIAGETVSESHFHLVYVVAECSKMIALVLAACLPSRQRMSVDGDPL